MKLLNVFFYFINIKEGSANIYSQLASKRKRRVFEEIKHLASDEPPKGPPTKGSWPHMSCLRVYKAENLGNRDWEYLRREWKRSRVGMV